MQATRRHVLDAVADGPISGPQLASRLDISRAAVWKHVEALRDDGFDIKGTADGYLLTGVPEFGGPAVEFGLTAPFDIEYHDNIDSTNDRARTLATSGASEVVVLADHQTGGRGRLDRAWASPSGGVWMSIVCRPDIPPAHAPITTLAAAVATTEAVQNRGVDAGIKWPNDVLAGPAERKLAGILTEMEGEADRVSWIVVGIGLNANIAADRLPEQATSLRLEVGDIDRADLTRDILERFDRFRRTPGDVLGRWEELSWTLGRAVRVSTPTGEIEGEAVDVEFPGTLVIQTDDGTVGVSAGDCDHLRPL